MFCTFGCRRTEQSAGSTGFIPVEPTGTPAEHASRELDTDAPVVTALFLGNSHSAPIPAELRELFAKHCPSVRVKFHKAASSGFLDEQARSEYVHEEIAKTRWDFVVLQAQKYSTTGRFTYPVDGAVALAKFAKGRGAQVILYPEFPRKGVDEYARIRAIHESIAEQTGARITPIGEAWSLAVSQIGEEPLYAPDGNHASERGSYLIASVFFRLLAPNKMVASAVEPEFVELWQAAAQAVVSTPLSRDNEVDGITGYQVQ